jgi:DNA-binding MarR family transcriptional regulator
MTPKISGILGHSTQKSAEMPKKIIPNKTSEIEEFDIGRYVPYLLNQATLAILPTFTPVLSKWGLALGAWRILAVLHKSGALRVRELLHLTGLEPPTLSRTLADLEKRKLVIRSPSANDARGILVETTREGNRVAEAIIPHAIAVQNSALRDLSPDEVEFLIRLLKRIHRSMGSTGAPS